MSSGTLASPRTTRRTRNHGTRLGTGIACAKTSRSASSCPSDTASGANGPSAALEIRVSACTVTDPPSAASALGSQA